MAVKSNDRRKGLRGNEGVLLMRRKLVPPLDGLYRPREAGEVAIPGDLEWKHLPGVQNRCSHWCGHRERSEHDGGRGGPQDRDIEAISRVGSEQQGFSIRYSV